MTCVAKSMFALVLCTAVCAFSAVAAAADDDDRIVVVGDLHGDMGQALRVLRAGGVVSNQPDYYSAKLGGVERALTWFKDPLHFRRNMPVDSDHINRNMVYNKRGQKMSGARADTFHWAGGHTRLVVVGDAFNVGPDDMDVAILLKRLAGEAEEAGGRVVFLLGNHELQNLQGNYMGVHPWSFERSGGREGRTLTLSMRSHLGQYLRSRPILHEEEGLIFMHGGIVPATVDRLRKLLPHAATPAKLVKQVNAHARRALESWTSTPSGSPTSHIKDPVAAFVLNWEYADDAADDASPVLVHPLDKCDEVVKANRMLGIEAQVVGHTPHDAPRYSFCGGELLAIDFKMSQWKAGPGTGYAALELRRTTARRNHTSSGRAAGQLRWRSRLIVPDETDDYGDKATKGGNGGGVGWRSFVTAVVLCVVVVELILLYLRRRFASKE